MERVLALQTLDALETEPTEPGCSGDSNGCSSSSSGTGKSTCSNSCGETEEMDW